jgi:hypothetical protein
VDFVETVTCAPTFPTAPSDVVLTLMIVILLVIMRKYTII